MPVINYIITIYRCPGDDLKKDGYKLIQVTLSTLPSDIQSWVEDLGGHYCEIEESTKTQQIPFV